MQAMPARDDVMTELTLEEADAVLPGLADFVQEGGAPPHPSFVPSSAARNDKRSNAGWGALVVTALGLGVTPVSIANATTSGPGWYGVIAIWFLGAALAVRKWLVLRGRRDEAPREGLFLLPAALLVVTERTTWHIPAVALHERGVQSGTRAGTASLRVRADTPRRGAPWTALGTFDLEALDLDERLGAWALAVG
jgi:hypothetical protein